MFMRRALYSLVRKQAERTQDIAIQENDWDKIEAKAEDLWKETWRMNATALGAISHPIDVLLSDETLLFMKLDGLA